MDVQSVFYIVGIVFMSLAILILLFIGYVLFALKQKITHLTNTVEEKLNIVSQIMDDPTEAAFSLGSHMANKAVRKVKSFIQK